MTDESFSFCDEKKRSAKQINLHDYCEYFNKKMKYCEICDIIIPNIADKIIEHNNTNQHTENINKNKTKNIKIYIYCDICNTIIENNEKSAKLHFSGKKHKKCIRFKKIFDNPKRQKYQKKYISTPRSKQILQPDINIIHNKTLSPQQHSLLVPCNTPVTHKLQSRSPSQSPSRSSTPSHTPLNTSLNTPLNTSLHTPQCAPLNIEKVEVFPKFDNTYVYIENNYFPHVENEIIELKNKPLTQMEMSIIFSGFMNHLGGFLFMGIADNGKICGINMTDKEIDQFKLFVDGVQQTGVHPPVSGIKVNIFDVYTYDLQKTGKCVFRLDIPKMEYKEYAKDGNSYTRYNASFRTDGITQFIHIDKLRKLQIEYNNLKKENMILKQQLSNFVAK
jgi:hypothetical protein